MSNTALDIIQPAPLLELLSEQFREPALERVLGVDDHLPWAVWDQALYGPLADFLGRQGKEFRARLVHAAWELAGRSDIPPLELPMIVEAIHAGSLIVDDIEDGSTYRRGEPALHCTWGVPRALNAGSWLYFWPDALLELMDLSPRVELELRRLIGRTLLRAHQGQALDLSTRVQDLAQRDVPSVVRVTTQLKTGALMELAAAVGAVAADGKPEAVAAVSRFGRELGVALQMLDDLGGIVSEARCHKGHEDLLLGRPTWPWAWAATALEPMRYGELVVLEREVARRDTHPEELAERLRDLVGARGKRAVRLHLAKTHADLMSVVGSSGVLSDLKQEMEKLEKSYG